MVSITTRNRPHVLGYSLEKFREVYDGLIIVIDDNSETEEYNRLICKKYDATHLYNERRLGIPRSKERGFWALLSFDHQFWFDDDCFPKPGWLERMLEATAHQGHLLHLREWKFLRRKKVYKNSLVAYNSATACFMSFRADMYKDVEGFQAGFGVYGGWHNTLSQKMAKYGLDEYVAVERSSDYLHSFDVDGVPADFDYMFQSSLPPHERK